MKKGLVILCTIFVCLFLALLLVLLFLAPPLVEAYSSFRALSEGVPDAILIAFYLCAVPAAAALLCLLALLRTIRREEPFAKRSATLMSVVSWCCVAVSLITAGAGFRYFPLFFIAVAMVFIFLIVRVVRMCFVAAAALKEENSLTI